MMRGCSSVANREGFLVGPVADKIQRGLFVVASAERKIIGRVNGADNYTDRTRLGWRKMS